MQNYICTAILLLSFAIGHSQTHSKETVVIETSMGNLKIKLFEETPLHKKNFLKLVRSGYYDSLMFHRVINEFMIQGGDPLGRRALPGDSLGHGDAGYTVDSEFRPGIIHTKGRLCAARDNEDINPTRSSSASQFYIVMGKTRTPEEMQKTAEKIDKRNQKYCASAFNNSEGGRALSMLLKRLTEQNKTDSIALVAAEIDKQIKKSCASIVPHKFTDQQISTYGKTPGTPHLDGFYTVFGEVVEGLEVIDKIVSVKTDGRDRPLTDIRMKVYVEGGKK